MTSPGAIRDRHPPETAPTSARALRTVHRSAGRCIRLLERRRRRRREPKGASNGATPKTDGLSRSAFTLAQMANKRIPSAVASNRVCVCALQSRHPGFAGNCLFSSFAKIAARIVLLDALWWGTLEDGLL